MEGSTWSYCRHDDLLAFDIIIFQCAWLADLIATSLLRERSSSSTATYCPSYLKTLDAVVSHVQLCDDQLLLKHQRQQWVALSPVTIKQNRWMVYTQTSPKVWLGTAI